MCTCPWLGRTSGMTSHDCEGVKAKPLASRGARHCMCPIFHAAAGRRGQKRRMQSALTRCASLHVSRFPDGSDAVRKDTRAVTAISGAPFLWLDGCRQLLIRYGKQGMQSKKTLRTGTTIWRQESYSWGTRTWLSHTTHDPMFMIHTLLLMALICLLQLLALDDVTHVMFYQYHKLIESLFTCAKLWEAKSVIMTSVKWASQESRTSPVQ